MALLRCGGCGVGFLHPMPDVQQGEKKPKPPLTPEEAEREVEVRAADVRFVERFTSPGNILDVGCGEGFFLAAAVRRGWNGEGIELSETSANMARRLFSLNIHMGNACKIHLPENSYDVVTFFHSLEHLSSPHVILRSVKRSLRPEGMVLVRIVNCDGFDARMLGTRWTGWALPDHLFHFSPRAIDAVFKANGFEVTLLVTDVSTLLFRFMLLPLTIPSHHFKLISFGKRTAPGIAQRLKDAVEEDHFPVPYLRQLMPGREMLAIARPVPE